MFERIGPDVVVAVAVTVWFFVAGARTLTAPVATGRRALTVPRWQLLARRARGALMILGAVAAGIGAVLGFLDVGVGLPYGFVVALVLSVLAGWEAVEALRPPLRPVRILLALVGFALAVFYAGFRG